MCVLHFINKKANYPCSKIWPGQNCYCSKFGHDKIVTVSNLAIQNYYCIKFGHWKLALCQNVTVANCRCSGM